MNLAVEDTISMSKTIEVTDEQYTIMTDAGAARGQSAEALFAEWVEQLRNPSTHPRYYTTDDFLRHLGASEEELAELERAVADEEAREPSSDADA
jgi:hypothetical protein